MSKKILVIVLSVGLIVAAGFGYGMMTKEDMNPSDVNSDGAVNLQDVSIVMSNFSAE